MLKTLIVGAAVFTGLLAFAPPASACGLSGRLGYGYPCQTPIAVPPGFVYQPYVPIYYAPPVGFFGSWWDPDYRAIRYNRYFQRYEEAPRIQGYTLR
jgi:hypothetical protein